MGVYAVPWVNEMLRQGPGEGNGDLLLVQCDPLPRALSEHLMRR